MLTIENTVEEVAGIMPDAVPSDILIAAEPVLLPGLIADWPAVGAGRRGTTAAIDYLRQFYQGATVGAFHSGPETNGRVFYNDDMSDFNYRSGTTTLDELLDQIVEHEGSDNAPMFYMGSTAVDTCLPGFRAENDVEFGDLEPLASIWLGNRSRIAAHSDMPDNLACVVAGRRRFILFPPDQIANLYVGPLEFNPAGLAISLVDFHNPDFDRFPKFRAALEHARVAELEPGDGLLIPSMWWHHVEALDSFNVLINYWWRQSPSFMGTPADVLTHAILAIRDLPPRQRDAWREMLRYYIFDADEKTVEHIPEHCRGMLAPLDEMTARRIRAELLNKLNR